MFNINNVRYNTEVSTNGFLETFYNCTNITSIPTDLFRYNTAVSTNGFTSTFSGCTSIASIPTDLFRHNTAVSTFGFRDTFRGCTSLTGIPTDLFRYNTAVSTGGFRETFRDCIKLQLNSNIFCDEATEKTTRFLNRVSSFETCFNISGAFTGTKGTAPTLWNYSYGTATPTTTTCFTGQSEDSLTNYADIPTAWGGA